MKILGIDPGYERIGIAVIEKKLSNKKEILLYSDCFKTSKDLTFPERLALIGKEIEKICDEYRPEALAIETLFFENNQKTAIRVAEARGVVIYEASRKNMSVYEYSPLQIKSAVGGHGRADKKDIIGMIPKLVKIDKAIKHDDEYDAIAVALTCSASENHYKKKVVDR